MLVANNPIHRADISRVRISFFSEEFLGERLGSAGNWFGRLADRQRLQSPVEAGILESYLHRAGSDPSNPNEIVAWHFTFKAGHVLTALWALSSKDTRRVSIERMHKEASKYALERAVCEEFFSNESAHVARVHFVLFTSGADIRKTPDLRSDALLFWDSYGPSKSEKPDLSTERVTAISIKSNEYYRGDLTVLFKGGVGTPDARVFRALQKIPLSDISYEKYSPGTTPSMDRERIFQAWQREGDARGFGSRYVDAVVQYARRDLGNAEAKSLRRIR